MNEPNEFSRLFGAVNDPLLCFLGLYSGNVLHYSPVPNNGDSFERWELLQVTHVHTVFVPILLHSLLRGLSDVIHLIVH